MEKDDNKKFISAIDYGSLATMEEYQEERPDEQDQRKEMSIAENILKQAKEKPELSDKEILEACIGSTNNQPNTSICAMLYRYSGDMEKFKNGENLLESDYTEEARRNFKNPILDIKLKDEFVQMDFKFKSGNDPELRILWSQLEMYGDLLNYYLLDKIQDFPFLIINIMPKQYIGRCYLTISNPYYWTLEPESPSVSVNNVIRLIVNANNIIVCDDVLDEVDVQQIDAEIKRSMR